MMGVNARRYLHPGLPKEDGSGIASRPRRIAGQLKQSLATITADNVEMFQQQVIDHDEQKHKGYQ